MKALRHFTLACLVGFIVTQAGCAGPSTPLGAVRTFVPGGGKIVSLIESSLISVGGDKTPGEDFPPSIRFYPLHQVLHRAHPLKVTIHDPDGISDTFDLRVDYNGFDVTASFLEQARLTRDAHGQQLAISVPSVRLNSAFEHTIEFSYRNSRGATVHTRYQAPVCQAFGDRKIATLDRFHTSPRMLDMIEKLSRESGFNPAFTAGLIAKESSFKLDAVSWARGIGLTQVTTLAENEIAGRLGDWPRYAGLSELPIPLLKGMIWSGTINSENEWRLDPEKSVRGGLAFLLYLFDRWSTAENNERILTAGSLSPEELRMRLVLASYNSGFARVSLAFHREPLTWQNDPELSGISKYLNQIVSYCDRFTQTPDSQEENQDESKT